MSFLRQKKKKKWRMYHPEGIACPGPFSLEGMGHFQMEKKSFDFRGNFFSGGGGG